MSLQDFRYPGSMGQQYFLGLEAIFKGSGDAAYPGEQIEERARERGPRLQLVWAKAGGDSQQGSGGGAQGRGRRRRCRVRDAGC